MKFKSVLMASAALLASAVMAQAADLPTKKGAAPAPAKIACWDSFYTWFQNSAADCPLSEFGFTFYGQIDVGVGYETNASRLNKDVAQGVSELISNTNHGARFQLTPNGLSQSNMGLKWKHQVATDTFFIGDVNFGFDPYSLRFADSPRSLVTNNTLPQWDRSTNSDSSRTYGPINTRAFAGFSNKTFGTLTYGRQYAFSNDNVNTYDPMGGAYAFSPIGYSSTLGGGLGITEEARFNNSLKYVYAGNGFRVGALTQVGGWGAGNNAKYGFQGDLGFDWQGFSFDGVYSYEKAAVSLGTLGSAATGLIPATGVAGVGASTLKATIQNVSAVQLAGKYKWDKVTLFGGWQLAHFTNPDNADLPFVNQVRYFNGGNLAIYGQNGGGTSQGQGPNNFPVARNLQVAWIGGKWAALPYLDLAAGYYHIWQNDFTGGLASCAPSAPLVTAGVSHPTKGTASSKCAGSEDALSGLIDWKVTKRFDVYLGTMYSKVRGGLASGFFADSNLATTGGVRLTF